MNEFNSGIPIYIQVINKLKKEMALSKIKPGDKLPSSRDLAIEYSINPNTASRVYREMELLGLCYTKRGLGTFVTEDEIMVNSIKENMAKEYTKGYVSSMGSLGYKKIEMIKLIESEEN